MTLRLLLFIDPTTPARFHALRWETLRDPRDGQPIATMRNVLFSRYLSNTGWRPIPARPTHELSALVVLASPRNLDDYAPYGRRLSAIDVDSELQRAQTALGGYRLTVLAPPGASLESIASELERGNHDILYLICHGALMRNESVLYLEGSDGTVDAASGAELVERLGELVQPPTLIVLGVPHTAEVGKEASSQDNGALAPLGLRLAEIGVAAVMAMQGNVSMRTVTTLMPIFFEELQRDGRVDRAMAVARSAIRERPDWWVPALFVRLRSGRVWHPTGFESGLSKGDIRSHAFTAGDTGPGPLDGWPGLRTDPRHVRPSRLRAFLCHSSSDKPAVRTLYSRLRDDNVEPWLDEEEILPGQDWDREIRKAIRACDVVLVCLSKNSVSKVGYIQKEIKDVLDVADEQPDGTIFLIPVRLEPCEVPDRITRWQWVDLFEEAGYELLIRALRYRSTLQDPS